MRFSPAAAGFRMPAEWETHEATWLTFPHNTEQTWLPEQIEAVRQAYFSMIEALVSSHKEPENAHREKVHLCVKDEATQQRVTQELERRGILESVVVHLIPTDSEWIRDYGGIFIKNDETGERTVLDWIFNNWGGKYEGTALNNAIPKYMSEIHKAERIEMDFVLEGGSIEVNGKGLMLTTKACLLNKNRNPKYTQIEIEQFLCDYFGARKVLWLDDGIVGDDTDGHIDDITRFVNENTVVTVIEEDPADANYHILQENLSLLQAMTDLEDKPLNIVTLPMPKPVFQGEDRLPASYANFYIGNEAVLLPQFDCQQDEKAVEILQKCFPSHKIVGINCTKVIEGLGAFHCLSQQVPL
jgi:agmatine deiminase